MIKNILVLLILMIGILGCATTNKLNATTSPALSSNDEVSKIQKNLNPTTEPEKNNKDWLLRSNKTKSKQGKLNKIAAIVNGDIITQYEVDKKMAINHQTKQQALDDLIDSILEIKLAQNNNIKISDIEINSIIANIAKNNNLSVAQLEEELRKTQGLTIKEYKEQLHDQIIVNKLEQQMFGKDIQISDKEIKQAMAEPIIIGQSSQEPLYHVIDILIETPDNTAQAQLVSAKNTATKIISKLKHSNDEKTITSNLKDPIQYNDLSLRKLKELPDLFINHIKNMQIGQVTGPIQAPNGLHVLKLVEALGTQQKTTLTKDQARELVFRKKLKEHAQKLIKELRESAYIKITN